MKIDKSNKVIIVLFIIILLAQIVAVIYATSKREYYHMDEIYSHGLINYKRAFIFENEDFLNEWHDSEYFKDYLTISEEEKWDFSAVYNNQIEDVHPPLYYLLLRIACSFNINEFSIWHGTILNIILFIFSSIMLYLIGKNVFNNKYYGLLLCLLNGFSIATIETVMYVRMYQLLILNLLILIYWHLIKKDKTSLNLKKDLIPLYFMIIIGFLSHYYYAIFLIILYVMYMIKYIKFKNWKNALEYTIVYISSALTSIIIFPYCINHIFFGYRGKEAISSVNINFYKIFILKFGENIRIINKEILNGYMPIIISIIILTFILLLVSKYKKKEKIGILKNTNLKYIIIPMVIYILVSTQTSPYLDLRYLMPITPLVFCTLLYLMRYILENLVHKKDTFYILLILILIFGLIAIPKLSDNLYTYKGSAVIKNDVINKPVIYVYTDTTAQYNKMMQVYNILLYAPETYILPDNEVSSDKIKEILQDKDISNGVIVIMNYLQEDECINEIYNTGMFNDVRGLYKINVFNIYLIK